MKQQKLFPFFFSMLMLISYVIPVYAGPAASIDGKTIVCVSSPESYTSSGPTYSGVPFSYHWSVSPTGSAIIIGSSSTVNIVFANVGITTIKVVRDTFGVAADSVTISVQVVPQPQPFITTDTRVACQSFDTTNKNPTPPLILSDSACVKVCDSTDVIYYANGGSITDKYKWDVTGGTIVGSDTADSVIVYWNSPGVGGSVTLSDTSIGGCYAVTSGCIQLIALPHAAFVIDSIAAPVAYDTVCYNTTVYFEDRSVADTTSSITSYHWTFGDDSTSSLQNPTHIFTLPGITMTVTLTVTNACGCSSSYSTLVYVNTGPGPRIECPSVVCQGDTATYYTPDSCVGGFYNWSVSPGDTILSSTPYGPKVVVQWNKGKASGNGLLSLSMSGCYGICTGATTVKIPVVQTTPVITGPSILCTHKPYQFSLPLWPGTQYHWGAIAHPNAIISGHTSNVVAVKYDTAGIYFIHVWYKNSVKLCGGDTTFKVSVSDPPVITGATAVCSGSSGTYNISPSGTSGNWSLSGPGGYDTSFSGGPYTVNFPNVGGIYILSFTPSPGLSSFCPPDPLYINVVKTPSPVDSIRGLLKVCLGHPYQYVAAIDDPGTTYKWTVGGGTAYETAGDSITVNWTRPSGDSLVVYRVSLDTPYCSSIGYYRSVRQKDFHPMIIGDSTVCSESTLTYSNNIDDSEDTYVKWTITPSGMGSITSGVEGNTVNVLWNKDLYNHYVDTAYISCTVSQCGTTFADTQKVQINPQSFIPILSLNNLPACDSQRVTFIVDTGADYWIWNFGDGSPIDTVYSDTVVHAFDLIPGRDQLCFVSVRANLTSGTCTGWATGSAEVEVRTATISLFTNDKISYCDSETVNDTLIASGSSGYTPDSSWYFWWYKDNTIIDSGTIDHMSLVVNDTGTYYVVFSPDSLAGHALCKYTSNEIQIVNTGSCPVIPSCPGTVTATITNNCAGNLFATAGSGGTDPHWTTSDGGKILSPYSDTTTIVYSAPGYYHIRLTELFDSCYKSQTFLDSVTFIPGIQRQWGIGNFPFTCTDNPYYYSIIYNNQCLTLPTWTQDSVFWTMHDLTTGTYTHYNSNSSGWELSLPEGTYVFSESFKAHCGTDTSVCTVPYTDTLHMPARDIGFPTISASRTSVCEGIPISLTCTIPSTSMPLSFYRWEFSDTSRSGLQTIEKTFRFDPRHTPPLITDYDTFKIYAIITDTFGCGYESAFVDTVYQNARNDQVLGDTFACEIGLDTLSILIHSGTPPATAYRWSDETTGSIDIPAYSGIYAATVYDKWGCWDKTNPSIDVTIPNQADLSIRGRTRYCYGETVALSCYQWPGYTYQWLRDGTAIGSDASIHDAGLYAGTYIYRLTATNTTFGCAPDTSLPDTVVIHTLPPVPNITGVSAISCPQYKIGITAIDTGSEGGFTYNWSNGVFGANDTVYEGGAYRVFATDTFGCTNYTDTLIPYSPESYLAWFPTGCYTFCWQAVRDSLYGPPGSFSGWNWQRNSTTFGSGTNSAVSPAAITASGYYQLALNNGLCDATSDTMNVSYQDCSTGCPALLSANLSCDASTPAGYTLTNLYYSSMAPGTKIYVGLDIGPVIPFSYTFTGGSPTLHFTTLHVPPPATALVEVKFVSPSGMVCYDTLRISVPYPCGWAAERQQPAATMQEDPTGMLVYPNPAGNVVNVNYNYGYQSGKHTQRAIMLYDILGRQVAIRYVTGATGTVQIPTNELVAGSYIVRMEENGTTLHTDHLSITH